MKWVWVLLLLCLPLIGEAQTVLLEEDFEGCIPPAFPQGWRVVNQNGDIDSFEVYENATYNHTPGGTKYACYKYNPHLPANDWFFTDSIPLIPTYTYKLTFWYRARFELCPESYEVYLFEHQAPLGNFLLLKSNYHVVNTEYRKDSVIFVAPHFNNNAYFLGFRCLSDTNGRYLYIDDIKVEFILERDVSADSLKVLNAPLWLGDTVQIQGFITNRTSNFTGDFWVYLLVDDTAVESTIVSLGGQESESVDFNWIPDSGGYYRLKMECDYPDDQIQDNDTVATHVYVYTGPWVESFTDENFPPVGWTVYNFDGDGTWSRVSGVYVDPPACAGIFNVVNSEPFGDWLISPHIKVLDSDTVSFWFRANWPLASHETLYVAISTAGRDTSDFVVVDTVVTDTSVYWQDWHRGDIPLDAYIGENIYIAFIYGRSVSGFNYGISIDVVEGPEPIKNDIVALSVNVDSLACLGDTLTLNAEFSNRGLETQYNVPVEIEVVSGIMSSLTYIDSVPWGYVASVDFPDPWVPDNIGCFTIKARTLHEDDEIPSNNTVYETVYIPPEGTFYRQDFEEFPFDHWFVEDVVGTSGDWSQAAAGGGTPIQSPLCGTYEARFNSSEADSGDCSRLVSWLIHIPSGPFVPYLGFWMYHDDTEPYNLDSLYIEVSDDIGSSYVTLAGFGRYSHNTRWQFHEVPLSDYKDKWVLISFKGKSAGGSDIYIDQMTLSTREFAAGPGDMVINEFSLRDSTPWIELYNPTEYVISIDGFKLRGFTGVEETLSGTIQPGAYNVVYLEHQDLADPEGGSISLIDDANQIIDFVAYGNKGGAPTSPFGSSVCRAPDGRDTDYDAIDFTIDPTPTPGGHNNALPADLGSSLVINECDMHGAIQIIELFNPTSEVVFIDSLDLSRIWYLSDGDTLAKIRIVDSILPGKVRCLYRGIDFSLDLDENDVIYLFSPQMRRVDQLGFLGKAESGSFQRYPDGAGPHDGYDFLSSGGNETLFDLHPTACYLNMSTTTVYYTGFEDPSSEDTGYVYNEGAGTRPHSWVRSSGFLYWGNSASFIDSVFPAAGDSFLVCAMDSLGYDDREHSWWYSLPEEGIDLSSYRNAIIEFDIWYHLESFYDSLYVLVTDRSLYYPDFYVLKGYTGNSNGWVHEQIDISAWCGRDQNSGDEHSDIQIAFLLVSNHENSGPEGYGFGGAVDNIRITAGGMYLPPPLNLQAESYVDGAINLNWEPPQVNMCYKFRKYIPNRDRIKNVVTASSIDRGSGNTVLGDNRRINEHAKVTLYRTGEANFSGNAPDVISVFIQNTRQNPAKYYIFRRQYRGRYFELIDSSTVTSYHDVGVSNGLWYEYVVRAIYDTSGLSWSNPSNISIARAGLPADVLLLGDFAGSPDDTLYWEKIESGILHAEKDYDEWNAEVLCRYPDSVDLYQYETLIWFSAGPGTAADTGFLTSVDQWLRNKPGRLMLFNRDFAWQFSEGPSAAQNFWGNFHTVYAGDYSGICTYLAGVSGDPISDPWSVESFSGQFGYNDFAGRGGEAEVIFTYGEGSTEDSVAATRYEDPVTGYRVVWAGFDVTDIGEDIMGKIFIANVLTWLENMGEPIYTRGDVNADGDVNVTDIIYLMSHMFPVADIPCARTGDFDGNNVIDVTDLSYGMQHMMPTPSYPPPDSCGNVPWDTLPCDSFPPCDWYGRATTPENRAGSSMLKIGKPIKLSKDVYSLPIKIVAGEEIAGFQVNLNFDTTELKFLRFEESQFVAKNFDFFGTYPSGGVIGLLGVISLQPSTDGIAGHLERGEYEIGHAIFSSRSGVVQVTLSDVVFTDKFCGSIYPKVEVDTHNGTKIPTNYGLRQNIPNPFSCVTSIQYLLPEDGWVRLCIYDISGRKVRTLVDKFERAGYKVTRWYGDDDNGHKVPPGTYFCRFESGSHQITRKLVLVR